MDSSKLACYINDTHTTCQYILDHYLPTIIIGFGILIVISVALVVFVYYR